MKAGQRESQDYAAGRLLSATVSFLFLAIPALCDPRDGALAPAACSDAGGEAVRLGGVTDRAEPALVDGRIVSLEDIEIPIGREGAWRTAAKRAIAAFAESGALELVSLQTLPDRWGRTIARLYVVNGRGRLDRLETRLVLAGLAKASPRWGPNACDEELLQAEAQARASAVGLWSSPDEALVDAAHAHDVDRRAGDYVVAEGEIVGVGFAYGSFFLNFGPDKQRDLALVASKAAAARFAAAGHRLSDAAGRRVRARGFLETAFSPRIRLETPLQIEWLSSAAPPSR